MTDIAVVGFAQSPNVRETEGTTNGVEMLVPCFQQLYAELGITKSDIGFWCSGSSDYLAGRAFSFISAIDAVGAVPPVNESHVEMDAAWALYEAWIKLLTGEVDTALVYGFGKSSAGNLRQVLAMQLDPYLVAPLWPDSLALAGLQARAGIDSGKWSERSMAEVAVRSREAAQHNPNAQLRDGPVDIETLLAMPYIANPLRKHDCAPITDGASAIVLTSGARARELRERPAWITGLEHRIDSPNLGARDLTVSPSTVSAAQAATNGDTAFDLAELYAPFTHQQLILAEAMNLKPDTVVNPSGGPLAGNPMFAAGLDRIGYAAQQIFAGNASRVLAHATSGPALQQNLVTVLEGRG